MGHSFGHKRHHSPIDNLYVLEIGVGLQYGASAFAGDK